MQLEGVKRRAAPFPFSIRFSFSSFSSLRGRKEPPTTSKKPISRRCQNAYRRFQITTSHNRPIWREDLDCIGGKKCNRFGICSAPSTLKPFAAIAFSLLVGLVVV
ncbi:hypothetical protein L596_014896 [Steinernema carpocapsae]|uniref:Uncharacterized protein n=1 Tax=Steinernema carpocapsae TaxID=34508 RepID=A0A4U5NDV9_STECR|nr:hypothetical protein L596_014896 [Steinernema carpocapsae]